MRRKNGEMVGVGGGEEIEERWREESCNWCVDERK